MQDRIDELTQRDKALYEAGKIEFEKVRESINGDETKTHQEQSCIVPALNKYGRVGFCRKYGVHAKKKSFCSGRTVDGGGGGH